MWWKVKESTVKSKKSYCHILQNNLWKHFILTYTYETKMGTSPTEGKKKSNTTLKEGYHKEKRDEWVPPTKGRLQIKKLNGHGTEGSQQNKYSPPKEDGK